MNAYVESYGCTLNQSDADRICGILEQNRAKIVSKPQDADFIFLNTCAVKLPTERRMISRIRLFSQLKATLVVCGCLPKMNMKELRKASEHAILMDTNSLSHIPTILSGSHDDFFSKKHANKLILPVSKFGLVTAVPIAEGCLGACAFCGTRNARGSLTSYQVKDIKAFCEKALRSGSKALLLTAEDTGVYGKDIDTDLPTLINAITSIRGDFRVRIGMMNPRAAKEILPELLDAYESEKVFKFVHIPVQSGADKVLKLMRRQHSAKDFEKIVAAFRARFPNICISTDIIVGFPGETDADFNKTVSLIKRTNPDIMNISKFFPRPNTAATKMKLIPTQITKRRSVELSTLCRKISLQQNKKYVGEEFDVFVLEKARKGGFVARAPNYKQVVLKSARIGEKRRVRVKGAYSNYMAAGFK